MKHYVVLTDWAVDYQTGHKVIGVFHELEKAKIAFKNRVDTDDRILAKEKGYEISIDDEMSFEAGKSGYYLGDHLFVEIVEIES